MKFHSWVFTAKRVSTTFLSIVSIGWLAVFASCSKSCKNSEHQSVIADMEFIPSDTSLVNVINLQKLVQFEFKGKDMQTLDPEAKEKYEAFVKKCGLDPIKQVEIVISTFGPTYDREPDDGMFVVRGHFSEKEILGCIDAYKDTGLLHSSSEFHGYTLHEVSVANNKKFVLVFPSGKDLFIIGKRARVEQSLNLRDKKGASAKGNQALMNLVDRASAGDASIWGVTLFSSDQALRVKNVTTRSLNVELSPKSMTWSLISKENAEFKLQVDVSNPEEAKKNVDVFNQKMEELKKVPQLQALGLLTFLNLVKVGMQSESIVLDVVLSRQQIDDLFSRLVGIGKSI